MLLALPLLAFFAAQDPSSSEPPYPVGLPAPVVALLKDGLFSDTATLHTWRDLLG